jgi:hypothetical protein
VDIDTTDGIPRTSLHPPPETAGQDHAPQDTPQDRAPFIERFHMGAAVSAAGAPIPDLGQSVPSYEALRNNLGPENMWYPFQSQRDWDFAQWAKNRGPSSTAVTELLAFDGVSLYQSEICFCS